MAAAATDDDDGGGGRGGACGPTTTTITSPTTTSGSGSKTGTAAPPVCSLPVYPKVVTAYLRDQMKRVQFDDSTCMEQALARMELPEGLRPGNPSRAIRDAAVVELRISVEEGVQEVDVMRGREMIKQQQQPVAWATEQSIGTDGTDGGHSNDDDVDNDNKKDDENNSNDVNTCSLSNNKSNGINSTTTTNLYSDHSDRGSMGSICLVVRRPG